MYSTRLHVYTRVSLTDNFARILARKGAPRVCRLSRRTSRRGLSCVSGSWQAELGSRRTRRHPRDDPRAEVGEDVRVGVGVRVGPVELQLFGTARLINSPSNSGTFQRHFALNTHLPTLFSIDGVTWQILQPVFGCPRSYGPRSLTSNGSRKVSFWCLSVCLSVPSYTARVFTVTMLLLSQNGLKCERVNVLLTCILLSGSPSYLCNHSVAAVLY